MTAEERMLVESLVAGISQRLDTIENRQETIRKENNAAHEQLFASINHLSVKGCAVGEKNSEAITELKNAPGKAVSIGAAIISSAAAALAVIWKHQ